MKLGLRASFIFDKKCLLLWETLSFLDLGVRALDLWMLEHWTCSCEAGPKAKWGNSLVIALFVSCFASLAACRLSLFVDLTLEDWTCHLEARPAARLHFS